METVASELEGACEGHMGSLPLVPSQVSKASERLLLEEFCIIPWSLGILSLVSNSSLIIKGGQSKQPVAGEERAG